MKNISFMGAVYSDVPAVTLPDAGGGVARFDDASITTATASDVASGKVFLAADGTITTGTSSGGGGSSSWTKVAETTYQVSTTGTSAATVATWESGHDEIWTSDKIVYIRIRDTAGKRTGYFYGVDAWFINRTPKNPSMGTYAQSSDLVYQIWRVNSNGEYSYRQGYNTTGYGVYPDTIYKNGNILIRKRYSSSYSSTINGTYKIEVYLLDPAGGVLPFA